MRRYRRLSVFLDFQSGMLRFELVEIEDIRCVCVAIWHFSYTTTAPLSPTILLLHIEGGSAVVSVAFESERTAFLSLTRSASTEQMWTIAPCVGVHFKPLMPDVVTASVTTRSVSAVGRLGPLILAWEGVLEA
ncbi:hypothetical protein EVAR_102588_1 [Eumeta japonica]|uniref:Uncharacterized protein n=1 Tax=Eumeta variegata TaxID=151549 RepID=A0A4C1TUR0_EUMVA|nr:hypothetical protein EVAR_102588_1 [Eumeta japonica]